MKRERGNDNDDNNNNKDGVIKYKKAILRGDSSLSMILERINEKDVGGGGGSGGGGNDGCEMDRLSGDVITPAEIEAELTRRGFLGAITGIREKLFERDPMLTILYDPNREISLPDGSPTTVINELLRSAHAECSRNYGKMYNEFELIQQNMKNLIASKDTHAKQMMFLCLLALEPGLQRELACHYPADGGCEINRLAPFMVAIRAEMEETLNTAYVNVPRPSPYNVDNLLLIFLANLSDKYRG
jgi:hypothetical protein